MFNLKNLRLYRLSRDVKFDIKQLQEQLAKYVFQPCGSQDQAKTGWIAPMGAAAEQLFHACNGHILLARRREEKILPRVVVQKELAQKIDRLESDQGRKLKKTEKDSLRDEVLHTLLPRAFSRHADIWVWIDTTSGLIAVDSATAKKAEDTLALLRKTLGSLPVVPLTLETPIELTLTQWVKQGRAAHPFDLGDSAVLHAILEDGGKVTCKKQELDSEEIASHLAAGKVITRLALAWHDARIWFSLSDDFGLTGIKYADQLTDQNDDIDREDAGARFDADVLLLTGELAKLISELISALGGEAKNQPSEAVAEDEHDFIDPLLEQAIQHVVSTGRPTISTIQRQFRIGYNRAARMIEAMEAKGIVSAPAHDGSRTVIAATEEQR